MILLVFYFIPFTHKHIFLLITQLMRSGNHYKLNFNIYLMLYSFLDIFLIFITNGNLEITIPFILLCKSIYYFFYILIFIMLCYNK